MIKIFDCRLYIHSDDLYDLLWGNLQRIPASNLDIRFGRAMLDDVAKEVSEALNRKTFMPEGELQDAHEEISGDIAIVESDQQDWAWWVSYSFNY